MLLRLAGILQPLGALWILPTGILPVQSVPLHMAPPPSPHSAPAMHRLDLQRSPDEQLELP